CMLKKIRVIMAVVVLLAATALFVDFTGRAASLWGWLAKIQFIPAVLAMNVAVVAGLIAMTLIFGRLYCSVICPLGVFQDAVSRIGGWFAPKAKCKAGRFGYRKGLTWLRGVLLAVFVVLTLAGLTSIAALIAPYSAFGRMVTALVRPLYVWGNNELAAYAESVGSYDVYAVEPAIVSPVLITVALVTLGVVGVMAWMGGRSYCNTVCPVGSVLGFLARYSWLRPVIDTAKCNGCGSCARHCKASCINAKKHEIDYSRCVTCFDCMDHCRTGALKYAPRRGGSRVATDDGVPTDDGRRKFVGLTALLAGGAAVKAAEKFADGGLAEIEPKSAPERKTPIVPHGAMSVANFNQHCVECQLCVNNCPNQVLRPSTKLDDGFLRPVMNYDRGFCRPECVKCSEVCPAGAIHPVTVAEKSSVSIGYAVVDLDNCLSATGISACGKCAAKCPAAAI
ncbi:MAG: 4Fe-4S binding protein, partial [Muribaculaceae bacterium]|nr:4Fe-4S binding protein [Muribaculaceae bacterium]